MVDNLNITSKTIQVGEDIEFPSYETRYFAESNDGFDGTAQGYGYKSKQKLILAHWYFLNKNKIKSWKGETKRFMKDNPEIKRLLNNYFDVSNCLDYAKNNEEMSIQDFINIILKDDGINSQELIMKLNEKKYLWKTIMQGEY
jgi:hypothetical protein